MKNRFFRVVCVVIAVLYLSSTTAFALGESTTNAQENEFKARVSSAESVGDLLEALQIECGENDRVMLIPDETDTLKRNNNLSFEGIVVERVNSDGSVDSNQISFIGSEGGDWVSKSLDVEKNELEKYVIKPEQKGTSRTLDAFSDNLIEIDVSAPVYGCDEFDYCIEVGVSYTKVITSNNTCRAFKPNYYYAKITALGTGLEEINTFSYGILLHGDVFEDVYPYNEVEDSFQQGYFLSEKERSSVTLGRTYTYSCLSDFEDEYPDEMIGFSSWYLAETPPLGGFLISYTIDVGRYNGIAWTHHISV